MMIDSVRTFLAANNWPIEPFGTETAIGSSYTGDNGRWPLMIETDEERGLIICRSGVPILVGATRRGQVALLLSRLNYDLLDGNFEMDMHSGDIRFRSSRQSWRSELSAEDCTLLVMSNVNTVDTYLPAIRAVAQHGAAIETALYGLADNDE